MYYRELRTCCFCNQFSERGTFGDVRKAKWQGRDVAVKLFSGVDRRGGISEGVRGKRGERAGVCEIELSVFGVQWRGILNS